MIDNSIRKFLIRNAIITYTCLAITAICIVVCFFSFTKGLEESRKYLYLIKTDGEIVPLEWVNRRENVSIEMKHHITMFVDHFYNLNQFKWEKNIEKALWLGNFEQQHIKRTNDGYYNRFIQYNAEQYAVLENESIELSSIDGKTMFRIIINLTENMGGMINKYVIFSKGEISITDRNFPHNPHGMFITNYLEEVIKKVE